jgi:hypothetical protein
VTLQTCADGRDCARLVRCSASFPKICLEAQECYDPAGKKRCIKLEECQCLVGDFTLADVGNGIRFEKENFNFNPKSAEEFTNVSALQSAHCGAVAQRGRPLIVPVVGAEPD